MKKAYKITLIIVLFLVALLVASVQRIDRTPYEDTAHYHKWRTWVSHAEIGHQDSLVNIQSSWAAENITPLSPGPMSGHGKRWGKHFESVRDSLYVKVIAVKSPLQTIYFLSADMLIIPPNVTERLEELLHDEGISLSDVHLGATHTHHGLGGWGERLTGWLFSGRYDPDVEEWLAVKFRDAILKSQHDLVPTEIFYAESNNEENIWYRPRIEGGVKDGLIRSLILRRADGQLARLVTYSAHATSLEYDFLRISRDYPGILVDSLENMDDSFAVFMAGAVGSMGVHSEGKSGIEKADNIANNILDHFRKSDVEPSPGELMSEYIELPMPEPTARISTNYALRPWVFKWLFGDYPTYVKVSKIGNTLILGMPADFSGEIMQELDEYAEAKDIDLIITSFNGGYVGYVTPDKLFDKEYYETITMAWNGYQSGGYFTKVAEDIIDKVSE